MARQRSFVSSMAQIQREASRAHAGQLRAQAQAQAAQARAHSAQLKAAAAQDREQKRLYADARAAEVAAMNTELTDRVTGLENVLAAGLRSHPALRLESLKHGPAAPNTGYRQWEIPEPTPERTSYLPQAPAGLAKLFGKAKYEQELAAAEARYADDLERHRQRESERVHLLQEAKAAFDAEVARQHAQIDALASAYLRGEPEAVMAYCELALAARMYPEPIASAFRLAYVPNSRQLVIEYELPTAQIIPTVKGYRYVKVSDTVTEIARPVAQCRALYSEVVAQLTLRVVGELFAADTGGHVESIVFNGVVDTIDPGSGRPVRPCLITLRTTKETFDQLDLARVEALACLKHLSASLSKSPTELVPVRPVLEFSMVDPRFITESDALSILDERPNLLELSPGEFEALVQNLFSRMGLETKQTRASRDGGVDCVAYDARPIFGGKVVIQAKRYKNTVGVSAVRDLYGTLQNEGASKGILVTTSGYGPASFDFAKNKPIELIDGAGLLYLLKAHTDIDARINAPEDWHDPAHDLGE
ncbi:MAG TPA: restriction endonuclease [Jatrophihabitans sp.]|jgi:restriction system protein|nr:restriction endonuclease [Jatrophihabitans sp.]